MYLGEVVVLKLRVLYPLLLLLTQPLLFSISICW
nr:hypothetical protein Q903MT_gene2908 [Picea sitchensis]